MSSATGLRPLREAGQGSSDCAYPTVPDRYQAMGKLWDTTPGWAEEAQSGGPGKSQSWLREPQACRACGLLVLRLSDIQAPLGVRVGSMEWGLDLAQGQVEDGGTPAGSGGDSSLFHPWGWRGWLGLGAQRGLVLDIRHGSVGEDLLYGSPQCILMKGRSPWC